MFSPQKYQTNSLCFYQNQITQLAFLPQNTVLPLYFCIIQHGKANRNQGQMKKLSKWFYLASLFDHQLANTIRKTAQEINDRVKVHFWRWAQTLAKEAGLEFIECDLNEFKVLKNHKIVFRLTTTKKNPDALKTGMVVAFLLLHLYSIQLVYSPTCCCSSRRPRN